MSVLLLAILLLLVAINGFFVAAEFALVRSRRGKIEQLAEEGERRRAEARWVEPARQGSSESALGLPGRDSRSASIGIGFLGEPSLAALLEPVFGGLSHGVARRPLGGDRLHPWSPPSTSASASSVPKMLAISHRRAQPARARLPAAGNWFRAATAPAVSAFRRDLQRGSVPPLRRAIPRTSKSTTRSMTSRRIIASSTSAASSTPTRPGCSAGLPPARAGGARGDDARSRVVTVDAEDTVETALRRCVSSGHTRLVVIEDDNPDRVRGIVHNDALARLMMNRPRRLDRPTRSTTPGSCRRRSRSTTYSRAAAPAQLHGRRRRRVRAHGRDRHGGGHPRGGRRRDRGRDRPEDAAVRQLSNGDWFVRGHVPLGDLADVGIELPVDTDAYNSVGGYVSARSEGLPKRGDQIQRRRLHDPRRVGAREPDRRGTDPPATPATRRRQRTLSSRQRFPLPSVVLLYVGAQSRSAVEERAHVGRPADRQAA